MTIVPLKSGGQPAGTTSAGNIDEARTLVARILQISPTASISHYMSINLYQRPEDIERMVGGLRLAGLPE